MKNKVNTICAAGLLLMFALGCGSLNPLSSSGDGDGTSDRSKTTGDRAVDVAVGDERIGIPECDAVMDELMGQARSEKDDEGYIVKAFRKYWENAIREAIRKSVEENKSDPEKLAGECKKIMAQLQRYKAEEAEKSGQ